MFTGLIKDLGTVESVQTNSTGALFTFSTKLAPQINIDDSVAVNGTCLTATSVDEKGFMAQAVHVTLEKTSLGKLKASSRVNLELALRPNDHLGGHFVQGHVNGLGVLKKINQRGGNYELEFGLPQSLMKYMISEGSIAIDGISLTVARVLSDGVMVSIIPHTWENTNLNTKKTGDLVNIEADMLAKYLENFLKFQNKELTAERLAHLGFE